jgi:hypothetical protein
LTHLLTIEPKSTTVNIDWVPYVVGKGLTAEQGNTSDFLDRGASVEMVKEVVSLTTTDTEPSFRYVASWAFTKAKNEAAVIRLIN